MHVSDYVFMKKLLIYFILLSLLFGLFLLIFLASFGGVDDADWGLDPAWSMYFPLELAAEKIQEFFTFGAQNKARLHIELAGERLSETIMILRRSGANATFGEEMSKRGAEKAQELFRRHMKKAVAILVEEKSKDEDMLWLAQELDSILETKEAEIKDAFDKKLDVMNGRELDIFEEIQVSFGAGDDARAQKFLDEFAQLNQKSKKELLEQAEIDIMKRFVFEKEKLERLLEPKIAAEKIIVRVEDVKSALLEKVKKEHITLPKADLKEFEKLLKEAQGSFAKSDFESARKSAREAEEKFDAVQQKFIELKRAPVVLTIDFAGTGSGSFQTTAYGGNSLSEDKFCDPCKKKFDRGTLVVIKAITAEGSKFTGWSGACSETSSCVVLLDSNKNVSINFTSKKPLVQKLPMYRYTHPLAGFSIDYPQTLKVVAAVEAGSKCAEITCFLVFKNPAYGEEGVNYIFVLLLADLKLTPETSEASLKKDVTEGKATPVKIGNRTIYKYSATSETALGLYKSFGIDPSREQFIYVVNAGDRAVIIGFRNPPPGAPASYSDYLDIQSLVIP